MPLHTQVVEEGVSGELVVPTMVERTLQVLGAANAAGKDYTHVRLLVLYLRAGGAGGLRRCTHAAVASSGQSPVLSCSRRGCATAMLSAVRVAQPGALAWGLMSVFLAAEDPCCMARTVPRLR